MSKGVKIALGVAAAVAVPFLAPVVGAALGISSAIAGALTGATLGGAAGAISGGGVRGALLGAGLGGLGGYAAGGGFSQLFGGIGGGGAAGATGGAGGGGVLPALGAGNVGQVGLSTVPSAGLPALGGAVAGGGGAATGLLGNVVNSVIQGAPNAIAQLSMLAYNKPPQELSAAQQAVLAQMQEDAKTNRELFTQRLQMAQDLVRSGQNPDFAGAYANAIVPAARAFREEERALLARGGSPEAAAALRRQGIIETTARAPRSVAVAGEEGRRTLALGAGLMPSQAPTDQTAAERLRIAERNKAEEDRRREQEARIVGGLFGTPGFQQNRYGGTGTAATGARTSTGTVAPQRTAGLAEPTYASIYDNSMNENWTSNVFG